MQRQDMVLQKPRHGPHADRGFEFRGKAGKAESAAMVSTVFAGDPASGNRRVRVRRKVVDEGRDRPGFNRCVWIEDIYEFRRGADLEPRADAEIVSRAKAAVAARLQHLK